MQVDPRGQRFAAGVTSAVLVAVLVTGSTALLIAQAVVFATGALLGARRFPYALLFRFAVRPRLGPPRELEDAAPPRFAQAVGLVFAAVGALGYGLGIEWLGALATAAALAAAFLNVAFGFCLGCEMYLLIRRVIPNRSDREVPV